MQSTFEQIREMAAAYSGRAPERITPNTRIFHDLALDGDDAEEFLLKLCKHFELSTEGFPFANYFGSEVGAGWRHLFVARFGVGTVAPLTVGELVEWAESGTFKERHAA